MKISLSFMISFLSVLSIRGGLIQNSWAQEKISTTRFTSYGCNAVSFAPIPGREDYFVGRRLENTDPENKCSGHQWTLVLAKLDHASNQFIAVHDVLDTPALIQDGGRINTAYDATVVLLNGAYWVAFECGGPGIVGAATCVGPLSDDRIDPQRTYVLVTGNDPRERPYTYSASAPKFLQDQGKLYLYWSAVKMQNQPWHWVSIATRGMEVTYDANRTEPLLPLGADGPVRSFDPNYNAEVWASTDMYSVQAWQGKFIATGAATSLACLKPTDPVPGCYHTVVGVSPGPLAVDGFKELGDLQKQIPANQASYVRLVIAKDGTASLIGQFGPVHFQDDRNVTPGISAVPIKLP